MIATWHAKNRWCDLYGNGEIMNFQINCPYTYWFPSFPAKVLSGPNTTNHYQSIRSYWFLSLAPVVCFNPFSSSSGQIFTEWFDLRQENWKRAGGHKQCFGIKSYQIYHIWSINQYQSITEMHGSFALFFENFCLCMHIRWSSILQGLVRIEFHGGNAPKNAASALPSRLIDLLPSLHEFNSTTSSQHAGQTCLTRQAVWRGMPWWLIYTTPTNRSQSLPNGCGSIEIKINCWQLSCVPWISVLGSLIHKLLQC